MERYERYEIPATAAYLLLASATKRRSKLGTLEALANMEVAAKRGKPITAHIEPFVAWLESGAIIDYLNPVQARRWLHENGYKEANHASADEIQQLQISPASRRP